MDSLRERLNFEPTKYYTHASMILFLLALFMKPGLLKTALFLNSVFVGLIGNLVVLKNATLWAETHSLYDILFGNFIFHTLPMFLSFLFLFGCPPKNGDAYKIQLLLSGLFLLWAAIPSQGMSMSEKVYDSYRIRVGVLVVMASSLAFSTCRAIEYFRG